MIHFKTVFSHWLFKDIRFWISLFFIIRLLGITNPPLEHAHNWRQTTVTMVSRNFYEVDSNILYPRIDIAGEKTGITGMEFPFLNYLIYLVSLVFGYQHWYGRLINLIISSIGIFFFFKIIKKYFNKDIAFNSSIVLLSSIWFAYSRKIMPDTFSMSLVLMGFYFGSSYFDTDKRKTLNLTLYFLFMLVGILSKLPSGYILVLFLLFFLNKKYDLKSKIIFSTTNIILFIPIGLWYMYWVPFLVQKYEFWHFFMGKSLSEGFNDICNNLNDTFANFYDTAIKFIGFSFFLFGVGLCFFQRNKLLIWILLLTLSAFSVIVFKAGYTFSHHTYYIIPFVPVLALFCGFGLNKLANTRLLYILLVAIALEGIINQQHDFFLRDKEVAFISLEGHLDKFSNRNDLVVINSEEGFPTPMYFAHRKGWLATNHEIEDNEFINSIKAKGCKYIIILKKTFGTNIDLQYKIVFNNEYYSIYKL